MEGDDLFRVTGVESPPLRKLYARRDGHASYQVCNRNHGPDGREDRESQGSASDVQEFIARTEAFIYELCRLNWAHIRPAEQACSPRQTP